MKTIYIHIGYPKTATSVLQSNLFLRQHDKGKINYLGKRSADIGKQKPITSFIKCILDGNCEWSKNLHLSSELPNVISFEELTISLLDNKCQNPLKAAKKLNTYFSKNYPDYTIKIIATLRNQVDLIHSFYTEAYMWHFRHDISVNTIDKYVAQGISNSENGVFLMYYYSMILNEYKKYFGINNIKILFYEDLKSDKDFYIEELSSFLSLEHNIILESFESKINTKKTDAKGYRSQPYTISMFFISDINKGGNIIIKIIRNLGKLSLFKMLYKFIYSNYGEKKISFGKKILFLSKSQSTLIKDHFYKENIKLAKEFDLDSKKMYKYDYL